MPRNGSGIYTLPQPPFVPNTVISSSAVNSDFSDIATALTGSLARDGQGGMTGALLAIDGTVGAPGVSFVADTDTGIRRSNTNELMAVAGGTDILAIAGTAVTLQSGINLNMTGALAITGTQTITNTTGTPLTITTTQTAVGLSIISTDASGTEGPDLVLYRDSASPAVNDVMGSIRFNGRDSGAALEQYAAIFSLITSPTAGAETARFQFRTKRAGTDRDWMLDGGAFFYQTGGLTDQGAGTLNATGLFVNGVAVGGGKVAQVVRGTNATYTTLGTILPLDDTIPQITEGDEVLTAAITPSNAGSTLQIEAILNVGSDQTAGIISAALFVDATANALAAASTFVQNTATMTPLVISFSVSAASTTARTYRVRAGSSVATDAYLNGDGTTRLFGGVAISSITVTEILP